MKNVYFMEKTKWTFWPTQYLLKICLYCIYSVFTLAIFMSPHDGIFLWDRARRCTFVRTPGKVWNMVLELL